MCYYPYYEVDGTRTCLGQVVKCFFWAGERTSEDAYLSRSELLTSEICSTWRIEYELSLIQFFVRANKRNESRRRHS